MKMLKSRRQPTNPRWTTRRSSLQHSLHRQSAFQIAGPILNKLPFYSNPHYTPICVLILHHALMSLFKFKPYSIVRFGSVYIGSCWWPGTINFGCIYNWIFSTEFKYNIIFFILFGSETYVAFKDALKRVAWIHICVFYLEIGSVQST